MAGISVSDIAFPLSQTEATNHMTSAQRQCTFRAPATSNVWWLRSPGNSTLGARYAFGSSGNFGGVGSTVTDTNAVRPAL